MLVTEKINIDTVLKHCAIITGLYHHAYLDVFYASIVFVVYNLIIQWKKLLDSWMDYKRERGAFSCLPNCNKTRSGFKFNSVPNLSHSFCFCFFVRFLSFFLLSYFLGLLASSGSPSDEIGMEEETKKFFFVLNFFLSLPLSHLSRLFLYPTDPFSTLELWNPPYNVPELHNIHQSPDREAANLWKGRSGAAFRV